jgi:uncharacterized membrane protein
MSDKKSDSLLEGKPKVSLILLSIWFAVSYGGIIFKEALDSIKLGGFPLVFGFAQGFNLCICHTDICLCSFDEQTRQKIRIRRRITKL